jgi:predicted small secreted protein
MKRTAILTLVLLFSTLASACNTIQGAGEDLQAGGKAIATTADKTKNAIDGQ